MKYAKTIGTVLLLTSLLAACGGGGGGGPAPVTYPPTIVDCAGTGSTGTVSAAVLAPNGTTPIAAATTAIGNQETICTAWLFGSCVSWLTYFVPVCSGETSTAGTIQFRNIPAETYELVAQAGMFSVSQSGVSVSAGGTGSVSLAISATAKRLGVVAGVYDSIENVLDRLGLAWEYIPKATLSDSATLNTYDAVFLNCGMDQVGGTAPPDGNPYDPYYSLDTTTATNVAANLQNFLATSGSNKRLYASDWAYVYVEKAFPSAINYVNADSIFDYSSWDQPRVGISGTITATINDAILITALGRSSMSVSFDLDDWAAIDAAGAGTATLISGDVTVNTDTGPFTYTNRPLMVSFPWGSSGGKVIYTSFHNEAQTTADMDRTLERIVFH